MSRKSVDQTFLLRSPDHLITNLHFWCSMNMKRLMIFYYFLLCSFPENTSFFTSSHSLWLLTFFWSGWLQGTHTKCLTLIIPYLLWKYEHFIMFWQYIIYRLNINTKKIWLITGHRYCQLSWHNIISMLVGLYIISTFRINASK